MSTNGAGAGGASGVAASTGAGVTSTELERAEGALNLRSELRVPFYEPGRDVTDEVAVRLSVPSPRFPASTVWVAPSDPGTTATVNAVCVSASLGAACNAAAPSRRNSPYLAKEKFFRTTWCAPSIDIDFVGSH